MVGTAEASECSLGNVEQNIAWAERSGYVTMTYEGTKKDLFYKNVNEILIAAGDNPAPESVTSQPIVVLGFPVDVAKKGIVAWFGENGCFRGGEPFDVGQMAQAVSAVESMN